MVLFKKKMGIDDFLLLLIADGFKVFENESDILILASDTKKVLTPEDKARLLELSRALVVVSIMVGKVAHYNDKVPGEEFAKKLNRLYLVYLKDIKRLNNQDVIKKMGQFSELGKACNYLFNNPTEPGSWAEERARLYKMDFAYNKGMITLCEAFADFYSKEKEKKIIAYLFSQFFVKNDMTGQYLKHFKIVF
jgi:hypothetical protein